MATRMGILTLPEGNKDDSIAYDGVIKLGHRALVALKAKKLTKHIGDHAVFPYTLDSRKRDDENLVTVL